MKAQDLLSVGGGWVGDMAELTEDEQRILGLEKLWWMYAGVKAAVVKETMGLSMGRYYMALNVLIDKPEALAAEPALVRRLQRLRADRAKQRASRLLGFEVEEG